MPYISTIARASANGLGYRGAEPAIGQAFQGGYYAGAYQLNGEKYYLVIAPASSEVQLPYWTGNNPNVSVIDVIDGLINTIVLAAGGESPAATYCDDYVNDGYSDWYLPAFWELEIIYYNLKPTTTDNSTTTGANPYAIPSRAGTNYTTTNPKQTSVGLFQQGNTEALQGFFWTSTEGTIVTRAYVKTFGTSPDGGSTEGTKTTSFVWVRPVRKVYAGTV